MILCACGCGKLIHKYGSRGRLNKFAKCHRTITDTVSNAARKNQLKGAETRRNKKLTKEFLIEEYVAKKKSATEIANEVGCGYCTVYRTLKRYGIPTRGCKQENHGQWKGGMVIGSGGYIKIMMPQHPMANKSGYVAEHVLVVEKK